MKPKILTFVRHYLPGYKSGGPQTSVLNLVNALSNEFEFKVVTLDRDLGDIESYEAIMPDAWNDVGGHKVWYLNTQNNTFAGIKDLLKKTEHDVLYLNGVFSFATTIRPLIVRKAMGNQKKPVIVAPRGSFSQGALSLKSTKKRVFLGAAKSLRLYKDAIWQASTDMEKTDIVRTVKVSTKSIVTAKDLPQKVRAASNKPRKTGEALRVVFLARIARMKNLAFALDALALCKTKVEFKIYGPLEDTLYWQECCEKIARLPEGIAVRYEGAVRPDQVASTLKCSDLLFLPTRGENYGHVIFEALANSTPVLVSDKTPWGNFPTDVGQVLPLDDLQVFADHIDHFSAKSAEELRNISERAHCHALAIEATNDDVVANRKMFLDALGKVN